MNGYSALPFGWHIIMKDKSAQSPGIERRLSNQERALVHLLLYRNLLCAADITHTLSREDVRSGQMTEDVFHLLQHKIESLQDGLEVIGKVAGITPKSGDALDRLGKLPSIIRIQAS